MLKLIAISTIGIALSAPAFAETRTYDFKTFTKIDISAAYEVIFTQSNQRSVTIESDDFSKITATQTGDTLTIGRPDNTRMRNKNTRDIVRISAPRDIRIDANAGVNVDLDGACDTLRIEASAGVDVDASDLRCKSADVDAGVGSSVKVHSIDRVKADAGLGASIVVAGAPKDVDKHVSLGGSVRLDR
jgi:hypothetical protein